MQRPLGSQAGYASGTRRERGREGQSPAAARSPATAAPGLPQWRTGPGGLPPPCQALPGAPAAHRTLGAPGCGRAQPGLRTARLVLPRRSRAPAAPHPPRGAQRLIPRSGSRPPSPFPLWPSPASGRPRGLPRPRAARARRSPGGPAPSRPPRLRGLKGGRPDSARRPPRAREGGGRPSGAARSPRSGGAAAGARRGPVRRGARARPAPVSPGRSPRRLGRQERRPGPAPGDGGARAGRSGPGSPRPLSRARGQPEEGCAERRGPVPSPQKRPCAGPVIANHQSPLITADEAGGGGAFPGAGRAGGERGALPRRSGR